MTEFLALDWDDQRLIGLDARVVPRSVHLRKWVRFNWAEGELPAEKPAIAGQRLRIELDRAGITSPAAIVSLPREEAVVRLLEFPDCPDEELPELVRFQAATRSTVPLDRLLLDFLPLPRTSGAPGRHALVTTLSKQASDRIGAFISAAGLTLEGIRLAAIGTAEIVARQPQNNPLEPAALALIVSRIGAQLEVVATWQNQVLFTHGATLSLHDPADAVVRQIVGETVRASVALAKAAPGSRVGEGRILGSRDEVIGLAEALGDRFGAPFQVLGDPFRLPVVRADFELSALPIHEAVAPLGLLLGQSGGLVASLDYLKPRKKIVKPDRRQLHRGLAGGAAALALVAGYTIVQLRAARLESVIASKESDQQDRRKQYEHAAPLLQTAKTLDDWNRRDIDWLAQLREIGTAMGQSSEGRLYLTEFDANVASRTALAVIAASGRAKSRDDVELLGDRLAERGYQVKPKEIPTDPTNSQFPQRVDLGLELTAAGLKGGAAPPPTAAATASTAAASATATSSPPRETRSRDTSAAASGSAPRAGEATPSATPGSAPPQSTEPRAEPASSTPRPSGSIPEATGKSKAGQSASGAPSTAAPAKETAVAPSDSAAPDAAPEAEPSASDSAASPTTGEAGK